MLASKIKWVSMCPRQKSGNFIKISGQYQENPKGNFGSCPVLEMWGKKSQMIKFRGKMCSRKWKIVAFYHILQPSSQTPDWRNLKFCISCCLESRNGFSAIKCLDFLAIFLTFPFFKKKCIFVKNCLTMPVGMHYKIYLYYRIELVLHNSLYSRIIQSRKHLVTGGRACTVVVLGVIQGFGGPSKAQEGLFSNISHYAAKSLWSLATEAL